MSTGGGYGTIKSSSAGGGKGGGGGAGGGERFVFPNSDNPGVSNAFCDNNVSTAKYDMFSFLPRSLFEQFRRVANLYFLFISILMLIGTYTTLFDSPLTPWSTLAVLVLVLAVSIGKEAVEDNKRHRADWETNRRLCSRLNLNPKQRGGGGGGGKEGKGGAGLDAASDEDFEDVCWRDVAVGNILFLSNNAELPADMVLLATSEPQGVAYIETSNIDGETNLKVKNSAHTGSSVGGGSAWSSHKELLEAGARNGLKIYLQCEQPNSAIHHFHGTLMCSGLGGSSSTSSSSKDGGDASLYSKEVHVDASSFLLRGSSLRNTRWALGLVVYTGKETKIVKNSRDAPSKLSSIESTMNNLLYLIFAAQVLISAISLVFFILWKSTYYDELDYLCYNSENSTNMVYKTDCSTTNDYSDGGYFFTFFILYNNFLPISLYVTVEVCNYIQAYFIDNDITMYDEVSNTPALARTSNMNSDLGMVEYVFSDKTGTLTDNVMRFRRCSIAGTVYGDAPTDELNAKMDADALRKNKRKRIQGAPLSEIAATSTTQLDTPIANFVLVMAVCHTMIVEEESGELQSESPDELALVQAAAELGWKFVGRLPGQVLLETSNDNATTKKATYEVLATVPFDSTRKRMSVVVRRPNGSIVVFCKGADNVVYDRMAKKRSKEAQDQKSALDKHLDMFASDGLRTLLLAKRELSQDEYQEFAEKWKEAQTSPIGREEMLADAAELIECELEILGATAIEDKLQAGVPQTIVDLGNAGVKLWVLTGDKMETAINIGYSARLLGPEMVLIKLHDNKKKSSQTRLSREIGESEGRSASIKRKMQALLNHFVRLTKDENAMQRIWKSMQSSLHRAFDWKKKRKQSSFSASSSFSSSSSSSPSKPRRSRSDGDSGGESDREDWSNSSMVEAPTHAPSLEQLTSEHLALIVDGETLLKIFGDAEAEKLFLSLATICKSVIACRVSPEQKRLVVRLVKKGISPRPVTLSIGDGANDVAMIQEAQIGVGISGKEGRQAVNSSDFAIAQFRFLKRLMIVHGRTDYRRTCKVVLYSFYKNIVLTLVLFAFTFYSGYSGQSLFDDYIYSSYNVILAAPVVAFGVFDVDISPETLERYNFLYVSGREGLDMNIPILLLQMLQAILDAAIIFYIPYYCYYGPADVWSGSSLLGSSTSTGTGLNEGIWVYGTTVFTCMVAAMFLRCAMLTHTWTYITHLCFWGSILLYLAFLFSYQYISYISYNYYGVTNEMMSLPTFWWLQLCVPLASALVELLLQIVKKEFFPTVVDIGMEFDQGLSKFTDLLQEDGEAETEDDEDGGARNKKKKMHNDDGGDDDDDDDDDDNDNEQGSLISATSGGSSGFADMEATLRYSQLLQSGSGRAQKYPLDWLSVKNLRDSIDAVEQAHFGIIDAEHGPAFSSYNYDHATNEGLGPGAGYKPPSFKSNSENSGVVSSLHIASGGVAAAAGGVGGGGGGSKLEQIAQLAAQKGSRGNAQGHVEEAADEEPEFF